MHARVLIVGSGPAGATAAIYAARADLAPVLVRGAQPGGQLTITTDVDNFPGFAETVQGPWLMAQMEAQARKVGTEIVEDTIVELDLGLRPFTAVGELGDTYTADSIILCTGATARWLGVPGEDVYRGAGVSACATCDGMFFKGKSVAVVGGGNTAVEEALLLSRIAERVTLIHRRGSLRAEKRLVANLAERPNVTVLWNLKVDRISGEGGRMTEVALRDVTTGVPQSHSFDGMFVAIGHDPNTAMVRGVLDLDEDGYIATAANSTRTNVPGVFAAGDVRDKIFRQAVTAAASGCMAALEAERFLQEHRASA